MMRALGYPRLISVRNRWMAHHCFTDRRLVANARGPSLQTPQVDNFRTPNFVLVADVLDWMVKRFVVMHLVVHRN
jgi:hypothetical protein